MAKTEPQQIGFADSAPFQVSYTQEVPTLSLPRLTRFRGVQKIIGAGLSGSVGSSPRWIRPPIQSWCRIYPRGHVSVWAGQAEGALTSAGRTRSCGRSPRTSFRPGVFSKFVERVTFEPVDDDSCRVHYRAGVDFTPLDGLSLASRSRGCLGAIGPTLQRMSELVFRERGTLTSGFGSRTMVHGIDCEGGGSAARS